MPVPDHSIFYDAAKAGGLLAFLYALGRGARWVFEFCVGRLDKRQESLSMREKEFEKRLTAEMQELREEVRRLRLATHMLSAELHRRDPGNAVLGQVADILGAGLPMQESDFDGANDDLVAKLNRVPGVSK